ncbi:hypothetical protein A2995_00880 [Candidatus Nomurabacteria bacterium RIFCSPLOWO2_01_FULL_33_24]|uniref:Uncharacterized protein n=1 Tax=Candidatus Nomurabacteria bacterium RIFCSPLOWO2_01_FULL_33_24 TaxID=1801765 RepID=A0A1F6X2N8_9BACT|nr:MAG: hypothetical protein A2995_00880 [Candidatus Nomurabacteria bacterium RIFCSPLOWO2_01_FULL_33_24]
MKINNLTRKQIVISMIIVVLIVVGVIYSAVSISKNEEINSENAKIPVVVDDENPNLDNIVDQESLISQLNQDNLGEIGEETSTASLSANEERFSFAMNNASKAFGKGEYDQAISYYNEALSQGSSKEDIVYAGLSTVYTAQNNIEQARIAIDKAIKFNPLYTEYWIWKLGLLDEKANLSFADLKRIYEEGLEKCDSRTKINLVTSFARLAENNEENDEAISAWEDAKEIYPLNKAIYQEEIDRLEINP